MTRHDYQDMSEGYSSPVYAYAPEAGDEDAGSVVLTDDGGRVLATVTPHQAKELASEISWSAVFAERNAS